MPKNQLYPGVRRRAARVGRPVRSAGRRAALNRLAVSGAPKFRRTTATKLAYGRKRSVMRRSMAAPAQGGLPSFSKWISSRPPSKRVLAMKRVGAPNQYIYNGATQIVNAEGFQASVNFPFQSLDLLKQIAVLVPGSGNSQPFQYVLESTTAELLMTNSSLATQYVDIYDIVRKRDQGNTDATKSPWHAWQYGVSDQTATAPDLTAFNNINSLPTDSRLFNDYFRVIKRTHIGLVAGGTHRHHVTLKCNKLIDSEVLNRASGDLAGIAVYTLLVINGQPASILQESGPAIVTTATTALDVVQAIRMKYTFVVDNRVAWTVSDNLSTLVGEQITQPSLGAFVTNTVK